MFRPCPVLKPAWASDIHTSFILGTFKRDHMYQLCISRERVIQSLDDVGSVCETRNGTGVHRRRRACYTQVALCPSLPDSSLANIPDDDPTHCGPAEIPTKGMIAFEVSMHVFVCRSKVRPVRLKLPILRFHGEEVTIPTTHLTPFTNNTHYTAPYVLSSLTESSALSVIHILSTISQVLHSLWQLA
jgi:hypothetical protein